MARALTTKAVEAAKPDPARRYEVPDPALTGLYLVVQSSGVKSWALRYRFSGKPAKLTLGRWPVMGVAEARAAAAEALQKIEHGADPAAEKKAAKAEQLEAQQSDRDKVRTLVEQFDRRHLSGLRTRRQVRQAFDNHILRLWGERDVQTITRRDVVDLLDGIVERGHTTTANRLRAYLSKFFGWCVEREIIDASPVLGVKPPAKNATRDRVLTDDEIRWLWAACDKIGQPWGPLAKMLLMTGQRLNEVAQMTEAEIRGGVWHLPAERTKNGRAHDVPVSEAAAAVLRGVERLRGPGGYLFTTNGRAAVSGFYKARTNIGKQMAAEAEKERGESVEIPHWTFHDLRRTAATGMARLGIPVRVTEAVLNHVSGTGGGIVSVYQRHDYTAEKAQALEAWGRRVLSLVEGKPNNVVSIAEARP